jgi:hypothetical protein
MATKFRDFDDWLMAQPEELQNVALKLRQLILGMHDGITEKMRFNVPFFDYYGWMIYLNVYKKSIDLCFLQGLHLPDEFGLLDVRKRKQIRSVPIKKMSDVPIDALHALIIDAMEVNRIMKEKKR